MLIAIDGYEAVQTQKVGIGRYAYEIINHIYKELEKNEHKDIKVKVYIPGSVPSSFPRQTTGFEYKKVMLSKFWTFFSLPLRIFFEKDRPDIIFSPTHYAPRFLSIPKAVSIMDLSYLSYPDLFRPKDLYQLKNWTRISLKNAAAVFTISMFSKNAIIKEYGINEESVIVTYPGLSIKSRNYMEKNQLLKKYNISPRYILTVGTLQPRKNFRKLIDAFSRLIRQSDEYSDMNLVIIGKKGWKYDDILSAPKEFNITKSVKFLDFVPDADLNSFYKHAQCFCLPSLYEGFGLPAAEAMAHECPVVVSDVSSLPEIAGKAGIYINPNNVTSIKDGIMKALREKGSSEDKKRIQKGLSHIKLFSWEKTAKQTLDVLTGFKKTI